MQSGRCAALKPMRTAMPLPGINMNAAGETAQGLPDVGHQAI